MNKKNIIGIPIKNFKNPMTRLSPILSVDKRIKLQKGLLLNIIKSFNIENNDLYLISQDIEIEELTIDLNINYFKSKEIGLNKEIIEFSNCFKNYENWVICHADLPYINRHIAKTIEAELNNIDILIARSKDSGTPLIAGKVYYSDFKFGANSFIKHLEVFIERKISFNQLFLNETSFELDDEKDYELFKKNTPRWYKKFEL